MSEAEPQPLKPFAVTRYVMFTTLWVFVLSGVVAHVVFLPLYVMMEFFIRERFHWIVYVGVSLALCVFLFYYCLKHQKRFSANLLEGRAAKSFSLLILPFWLPLSWGLVMSTIAFTVAPISLDAYKACILFSNLQYFLLYIGAEIGSDMETFVVFACIANFLLATTGTLYVAQLVPSVPKARGLILCATITLLLCGLVGLSHKHFRTEILPPFPGQEIIRDERIRIWHSDTDLSEYIPFKENNKLVKIESPTLVIDSEHPRLHGAFALYPLYAAAVEAIYRNTEEIELDYRQLNRQVSHVQVGTSPRAFGTLIDERDWLRYDMIFMARPSEKQLQEAANKGVELVITPIGYEAFVFFVSIVNPVDSLTLEQIRDIYSKRITRWEELGGSRERILPFQRPEGSGSQTAMLRLMEDVPMTPPQREEFRDGMGGIVRDVADYRNYGNAIGFSFRYYVEGLFKHDGVKLLQIDGIAPTVENIQNKSYPLIGEIVIISRADNTNPNVPKLTEWFLSPQGQQLVRDVGYVPLTVPLTNESRESSAL